MPSLVITRGRATGRDERVGTQCLIGRTDGADVVVEEPSVSRRHARIAFEDGMYVLYDLGSRNGTFVNGQPVRAVVLDDHDVIRLGRVELVFCWAGFAVGATLARTPAAQAPAAVAASTHRRTHGRRRRRAAV